MDNSKVVTEFTNGQIVINLKSAIAFKMEKESKDNFGFENQLISKHGSMVRIDTEITTAYLVEAINKKTSVKEFYMWIIENEFANQQAVGHYLKVGVATIITEDSDVYESIEFILS